MGKTTFHVSRFMVRQSCCTVVLTVLAQSIAEVGQCTESKQEENMGSENESLPIMCDLVPLLECKICCSKADEKKS